MNTLKRMAAVLVALMLLLGWSPAPQSAGGTVLILSAQAAGSPSEAPVTKGDDPATKIRKLKVGHSTTVTINGVKYKLKKLNKNGDLKLLKAWSDSKKKITVPARIGGCKITTIGTKAFKNCKKATSIVLPTTITKICKCAFQGSVVQTLTIKSKKLKKASVKGALTGALKLKTIKVPKSKTKAYKKIFTKKIAGKKVKVV